MVIRIPPACGKLQRFTLLAASEFRVSQQVGLVGEFPAPSTIKFPSPTST
jgi:hypothetical protein